MGSVWFAEVQSGSQGFFEVHLGSVRFNEVQWGYKELQGVTRKKRTATDLLVLTRLFGT